MTYAEARLLLRAELAKQRMAAHEGNRTHAARSLGITRQCLLNWMRDAGMIGGG